MNLIHEPIQVESGTSDLLILYIHGLMGSPLESTKIWNSLDNLNFHGQAILLPGHGGSAHDFGSNGPQAWQAHVNRTLADLSKSYARIILIGHSLGGLLALQASLQIPVNGIVLLNTPAKTHISLRQISISARVLFSSDQTHDPLISAYRKSFSVGMQDFWNLPLWIPRLMDIRRVADRTMSILKQVTVPVMIFQSRQDETVNPISAEQLKKGLGEHAIGLTYLEKSSHAYFVDEDFQNIIQGIKRLIDLTN
jgi:carboxylesterase